MRTPSPPNPLLTIAAAGGLALAGTIRAAGRDSMWSGSAASEPSEPSPARPRLLLDEQSPYIRALVEEVASIEVDAAKSNPKTQTNTILGEFEALMRLRATRDRVAAAARARHVDPEFLETLLFRSMVDYVKSGRQAFVVGPRLQEMFVQTSLPEQIEQWMLRAPYPAFYIALPDCEERIWGIYQAEIPVQGMMIDLQYELGSMAILAWAPASIDRTIIHYDLDERKLTPELRNRLKAMGNDSYLVFNIEDAITHPRGIEAYIFDQWAAAVAKAGWSQVAIKATAQSRVNLLKIALGTLLYLQSERQELTIDPDAERAAAERAELAERLRRLKTPAKRRKIEEKLKSTAEGSTVTWLGRSIEQAPHGESEAVDPRAPIMPRRHWVRGHWRRPARRHGPRVLVWVQPFLRGSGEIIPGRTYKFAEDEGRP